MGPKSYEEAGESPLAFTVVNVKVAGQQTHIILTGRDEVVAVRSVQLLTSASLQMLHEFS